MKYVTTTNLVTQVSKDKFAFFNFMGNSSKLNLKTQNVMLLLKAATSRCISY